MEVQKTALTNKTLTAHVHNAETEQLVVNSRLTLYKQGIKLYTNQKTRSSYTQYTYSPPII